MNWIAEVLEEHIKENPEHRFLFDEKNPYGITFKELYDLSGKVYAYLKNKGIGKEDFVLINLERGINLFVAFMGVLRAGAAFTIVENTDPIERIKYIYNNCNCKLEINEDVWKDILKIESLNGYENVDDHDAAYAVYTSGTTGNPKGVLHEYGNLKEARDSFYHWGKPLVAEDENFAFISSLSFVALTMYCIPLFNQKKSKIHIIPNSIKKEPVKLLSYLKTNKITSVFLSPSYVRVIGEENLSFLKKLFIGSESINGITPPKDVATYNTYGMSESGFWVGLFKIDKKYDNYPIGQPQFDKKVYLLDENNNEVADGEVGEFCFDNPFVRGYINLPKENKRAFQNGIFHTNDLAKKLPNTDYLLIGRKSDMVKINGNRVEPAEVEAVIRNVLNIDWCGVRGFEDYENAYLAAYYTADISFDVNELREKLSKKLPYYMVPSYFVKINEIPVNRNGKFDRKSLPVPELKAEEIVLPETDFEKQMFDVVSKKLKIKDFGVTTNLISMGLTSIKAIKLSATINKETNYSIKTSDILSKPYIREWLNFVDKETETIEILPPEKIYPLTPNQLGIYIDWERNKNGLQYNIPLLVKSNNINPEKLLNALYKVIETHPYFKVHIVSNKTGEIIQERRDKEKLQIIFKKLNTEPDSKFFRQRIKPFNLLKDDLSRFEIYYTNNKTYLFADIHHILFDGSSANILFSELFKAYNDQELNTEQATAYDYSLFFENWKQSENYTKSEKYFSELLSDTESFMYPSINNNAQATGKSETYIKEIKQQEIKEYCSKSGITENAFWGTVLTQVFHRISREKTIQISTLSSGRGIEQLSNTIGMFVQTLPVVSKNSKGKIADLLKSMQEQSISTINNDKFPYTELVQKYNVKPNIIYAYQGDVIDKDNLLEFEKIQLESDTVKAQITIDITPKNNNYCFVFEYDNGLYTKVEMERLAQYISNFANNLIEQDNNTLIEKIPLISKEEKQELITLGTGEKLEYDKSETFVDLFLKQVKENPENTAVVDYKSSISYAELDKQTNILAGVLIKKGIKPNDFVGVKLPRIKEFMVAVIAIFKAGAAYVPIDPNYPQDRINYMITDSQSKVVIDEEFLSNIDFNCDISPINLTTPENTAYMIYTSGSTGKPKGVMIRQKSLTAFITWLSKELELKQNDNIAEYSSFSFDASVCDLYPSLIKGTTLHILGSDLIKDFTGLENYIQDNNIIGSTLPTQLGMDFINESNTNLRYLILGGDKLKLTKETTTRIYNGYGPTEFTVWATSHVVDFEKDTKDIPIGRPVPNSTVAVVDENGNLLPKGINGELVLIGSQISKGYWNREDLTKEKFADCPFIKNEKMYRTGDLVHWNENDELMFIGRIDNQVKLRGFRIELGEIESALSEINNIKSCVAEIKTIHDIQHLIAYYVSDNEINSEILKQELSKTLTEYMVPDKFIHLDKMPLTPNGKVDRKSLPIPEITTSEYVVTVGKTEEIIALNIQEVLNISVPIGRTDSFLSLGGDSIKSIRLVSKLREAGLVVTVSDIMKAKTVQGIAALAKIESTFKADQTDWSGEAELTAIQKEFFNDWKLTTPNHFNQSLMFVVSSRINKDILLKALEKLVCHHDMLRATYKDGVQYVRKTENDGELFTLDFVETDDLSAIANKANALQISFNIEQGPLFKACIFRKTDTDYLFIVIHHLVIDGVSWRILIEDLENIYKQIENNQNVKLPKKTTSFRDWSLAVRRYADSELLKREVDYWKETEEKILNTKHTEKRSSETFHIDKTLSSDTFELLRGKSLEAYHTEINDLMLTALSRAYKSVTGETSLSIQLESHGREPIGEETQIDRTIGWFTSICPLIIESHEDIRKNIFHTKEALRRIPNHGIGYGILKHFSDDLSAEQVIPTLIFNYLGIFKEGGEDNLFNIDYALPLGNPIAKNNIFGPAMAINCFGISDNSLKIWFDYDTSVWNKNNAEQFANMFIEEINNIIEHTLNVATQEYTASDLGEYSWSDEEFCNVLADFKERNEEIKRIYPLTNMQNSMLLKAIAEPDSSAYHVAIQIKIDILPSQEQLSYAFNKLLDKHEVLRTSVIYKNIAEPRQAIISGRKIPVDMSDISKEQDINRACSELEEKLFDQPIDLQYSPLFKLTCAKTGDNSAVLIFIMHHIIVDGWCNSIWIKDFCTFLSETIENNKTIEDYTGSERKFENFVRDILSKDKRKAKEYWNNLLAEYDTKTEIIPHEKVNDNNRATSNEINMELSVEDTKALNETCAKANCTINNAVETAIGILLQKYNRVNDSLFVKVVSGRDNSKDDISDLVGICLNSVPVRVKTLANDSISDLLNKVQQQSVETSKYDWYPLSDIQVSSTLKNNLFQIIYAFENYATQKITNSKFNIEMSGKETNITDIGISAFVKNNSLTINIKFDINKFSKTEIEQVMNVLKNILLTFAKTPEAKISSIPLVSKEEAQKLITLGTGGKLEYDKTTTFVDLFIKQVKENPNSTAVVDYKSSISYAELDRQTNILANALIKQGIKPNDFVGVQLPRIKEFMIAVIGIWKSGAAYVPIDPEYPQDRINYMIEDSKSKMVIDEELLSDIDFNTDVKAINLTTPNNLAYMIYTSGSTGKPKGVMISQKNLRCFITWLGNMVHIQQNDNIGEYVSFCFDGSTGDLYPSLANGATLHILSSELRKNIIQLKKYISHNKIRGMVLITSMAIAILEDGKVDLDYMLVGGEPVIPFKPANINFYNVYGPTEFTNMSVVGLVDQRFPYSSVPIGRPVPNSTVAVVDENCNLLPRGLEGELVLIGTQISKGYWNRPELTKEKFVDCPFIKNEKMYRTGDLVRWNENDELLFIGRIDNQVKLRGFRIELGEIESVLSKINGIKACAAEVKTINNTQHLIGYYASEKELNAEELKQELSKTLTEYMIPDKFVHLDNMPLTPNGKVDRKNLPLPAKQTQDKKQIRELTYFEEELSKILEGILKHDDFDICSDFLELGLTSISAMKFTALIYKKFNCNIKVSDILNKCNILKLENIIQKELLIRKDEKNERNEKTENNLEIIEKVELISAQEGVYYDTIKNPNSTIYNIPVEIILDKKLNENKIKNSLEQLFKYHKIFNSYIVSDEKVYLKYDKNIKHNIAVTEMTDKNYQEYKNTFVKPFVLQEKILFRCEIVKTELNIYILFDIHHIIFDGISFGILIKEFKNLYENNILPNETNNIFDYAKLENKLINSNKYPEAKNFFDNILENFETCSGLPTDMVSNSIGNLKEATQRTNTEKILSFCKKNKITPAQFFLSAISYTLSRYINNKEIFISTTSNGRNNPIFNNTLGMFVKTLPFAGKIVNGKNVLEFIKQTGENFRNVIGNDIYALTEVNKTCNYVPKILYTCQLGLQENNTIENTEISIKPLIMETPKVPLAISVENDKEDIVINMHYDSNLYFENTIKEFAYSVNVVINNFIDNPENKIEHISLIDKVGEKKLQKIRQGKIVEIDEKILHRKFERCVDLYPDKTSLVATDGEFTYKVIEENSNRIAQYLISKGIQIEDKVIFILPRTSKLIFTMLGILKSGACYIPCIPDYPKERIDEIATDSRAKFIICEGDNVSLYENALDINEILKFDNTNRPEPDIKPNNLAYMIYTSGTTGKPKGVLIEHESVSNILIADKSNQQTYNVTKSGSCLSLATIAFDMASAEIFTGLCNCQKLVFADEEQARDVIKLTELIKKTKPKSIITTPSRMQQFIEWPDFCLELKEIKCITCGAEGFPITLYNKLKNITDAKIVNGYGPTENTMFVNTAAISDKDTKVTIGKPIPNTIEFIADSDGNELPQGIMGELYIGGLGTARGYQNNKELTDKKFITFKGKRVYKSGDFAKWTDNGEVDILGRIDNQVKLRGLRIELDEVNGTILSFENITNSIVLVKKINGEENLCAYFTASTKIDINKLKEHLSGILPHYMVPSFIMQLDKFPTNKNGKLNKQELPDFIQTETKIIQKATNKIEQDFCDIFSNILNNKNISVTDSFFEIGGTSLLVTRIIVEAKKLNYNINYGDVFNAKTPQKLAQICNNISKNKNNTDNETDNFDYSKINDLLKENNINNFLSGETFELKDVLLTGATGFLGIHILVDFLQHEKGKIYCLLRKGRFSNVKERLTELLMYYFGENIYSRYEDRIIPIEGDITDKNIFKNLENLDINTILNCAANVKHYSHDDNIKQVNYVGVLNLIELCKKKNIRLIQTSTTSISGFSINNSLPFDTTLDEQKLYYGQNLDNKYIYSKFIAERQILDEISKGNLDGKIMRLGNLSSRNSDGEFQINATTNSFMNRFRAFNKLCCYPYSAVNEAAELSPIDCVARAIVLLSTAPKQCTVFHPFNNHIIRMGDIITIIQNNGLKVDFVEDDKYIEVLKGIQDKQENAEFLSSIVAYQDIAHGNKVQVVEAQNNYTTQILYRLGYSMPITEEDYINKVFDSLIALGFFE